MQIAKIGLLLTREFTSELRSKEQLLSSLVQVVITLFIVYLSSPFIEEKYWNVFLWICILFNSIHAVGRSFLSQKIGLSLYLFQIASPKEIIVSKLLFNCLMSIAIGLLTLGLMIFFFPHPKLNFEPLLISTLLFCFGTSALFTFSSSLAVGLKGANVIFPILSFPLSLPLLLLTVKSGKRAFLLENIVWMNEHWFMLIVSIMISIFTVVLFPFVWGE